MTPTNPFVMAGLDPAIHVLFFSAIIQDVHARDKTVGKTRFALLRGHDEEKSFLRLERPRQQAFDRRVDRHFPAQYRRDRF